EDNNAPNGHLDDDDVEPINISASGVEAIWFEHPSIDTIKFYKSKQCLATDEITFPYPLSSGSLPRTIYIRADGAFTGQSEGDLVLKLGSLDKSSVKAKDTLTFTIVKHVGDKKFFDASRDYILENNTKYYATRKSYAGEMMRMVVMREAGAKMTALDSYYRNPRLRGIDAVVGAFPGQTVVINGNFGEDLAFFSGGAETTTHLGRLISDGVYHSDISLDSTESNKILAGPNAYYVAQTGSAFTFARGEVPLNTGIQNALGGLNHVFSSETEAEAASMIGYATTTSNENLIFVNTTDMNVSPSGSGNGVIGFRDDAITGSGASEVFLLDGSSSVALAYQRPDGILTRQYQGSKHNYPPFPYHIHTYLMFDC
ncbi:MAG: hypothetical protein MN733_00185, partial [Nitrososphaera sp.]|nr:hypothetical protein [Nitrososphaera sp.]